MQAALLPPKSVRRPAQKRDRDGAGWHRRLWLWRVPLVTVRGSGDPRHGVEALPGDDAWATQRLAAIAGNADRQAFAELFQWYAPRIKAFMMRGGTDADRAQEIAQEVMISVWRRAATFDPSLARPVTWIYAIARNRRIDLVRRDRRFEVALNDLQPLREDPESDTDTGIRAVETGDRIRASMDQLGGDQLEVIRKAFFEEKSHTQIASELGLPLGTVKSRIRHALLRLRGLMREDGR